MDYIDRNATQAWKVYKESWNAGHEKQKNRKTRGEAEREDVIREAPELQKEAAERLGGQHVQTEQDGARGSGPSRPLQAFFLPRLGWSLALSTPMFTEHTCRLEAPGNF